MTSKFFTPSIFDQNIENVGLWDLDPEDDEPKHVIVNTEWGAFGDNGELVLHNQIKRRFRSHI